MTFKTTSNSFRKKPCNFFTDHLAHKFPVSIKGIVCCDNKYLLRKNERDEWELLGGKLELHEKPHLCVTREINEESGIDATTVMLLDAWVYRIANSVDVLILTYICHMHQSSNAVQSPEGAKLRWFTYKEIKKLKMPSGYKKSINKYEKLKNFLSVFP